MHIHAGRIQTVMMVAAAAFVSAGCAEEKFSSTVLNPFNLDLPFLPYEEPLRIGIANEQRGLLDPASWDVLNVGSPWTPLASKMQKHFDRPVQIIELEPFQIAAHLQSGRIQFALVGAGDYIDLDREFGPLGQVLVVSEVRTRQGLIVVNAKSNIHTWDDLRGKRFAFGPINDPVLHDGAKKALVAAGVSLDSLQKEILPIPNTYQHHISSREVAFEVAYGLGTDAGVIDRSEYEEYPDVGGSFLLRTFSKENFRVLGTTEEFSVQTIPAGPVVASVEAPADSVESMTEFLLSASRNCRSALSALGLSGFHPPETDVNDQMRRLASTTHATASADNPPQ